MKYTIILILVLFPLSTSGQGIDAKSAIQEELGIEKNQLDNFIKKYIPDYSVN